VEVTAPIEPQGGVAAFSAKINYMVCKDICMVGRPPLQMINVETASGPAPEGDGDSTVDPVVAAFKSRLPKPLKDASGAEAKFEGSTLTVRLPSQNRTTGEFFPLEVPGVSYGEAAVSVDGSFLQFKIPVTVNPNDAMGKKMVIAGVAGLGTSQSDPCYQFEIPLPAS
jgi:DsbC/DsbD-like thiol-disulfide interchange protein